MPEARVPFPVHGYIDIERHAAWSGKEEWWSVNFHYTFEYDKSVGFRKPSCGRLNTLAECYDFIVRYHLDAPSPECQPEDDCRNLNFGISPGNIVELVCLENGWRSTVVIERHYLSGNFGQRMGVFCSLKDAISHIQRTCHVQ
jgi:hypothetical protein